MTRPVGIVVGIGPGNGAAIARRLAAEGYALALMGRDPANSAGLLAELPGSRFYRCDAGSPASIEEAFGAARQELGDAEVLVWNAGSGSFGTIEQVSLEDFEAAWRVNALGAFAASRLVIPAMRARGAGSIVFIGATASVKAGTRSGAFGPAKFAQRGLAQTMARSLWPAGIHVALVVVDGVVDLPRTRGRMADKPDDFFIKPEGVAETVLQLVRQERSAWSFEVEARPFGESW